MSEIITEKQSEIVIKKQMQLEGKKEKFSKELYGINLEEFFYLLFFGAMFGIRSIGFYEGQKVYNVAIVIGMCFWICKIAATRYTLSEYILIFSLMTVAGLVYLNSGEKGLLFDFAMMLGMKGVSSRRVIKLATAILAPSMVILTLLSVTGVIDNTYFLTNRIIIGPSFKVSMGYPHPNTAQTTLFILCVMLIYLVSDKVSIKQTLIIATLLAGISFYYFLYTLSYTGIMMYFLFILFYFVFRNKRNISGFWRLTVFLFYPIACALMFAIVYLGGRYITPEMTFKSGLYGVVLDRIRLAGYYIINNPVTLFGQRLTNPGQEFFGVDISPVYLMLSCGIVPFFIVMGIWLFTLNELILKHRTCELSIAITFLIMGFSDPFLYNLSFKNIFFIFAGECIYERLGTNTRRKNTREIAVFKNGKCQVLVDGSRMLFEIKSNFKKILINKHIIYKRLNRAAAVFFLSLMLFEGIIRVPRANLIYSDFGVGQSSEMTAAELLNRERAGDIILGNTHVYKWSSDTCVMYTTADKWSVDVPEGAWVTDKLVKYEALKKALSISVWITGMLYATISIVYTVSNIRKRQGCC